MKKLLATAGPIAMLAFTSAPAMAASPQAQANATARVYRPLVLSSDQNLDLGTIVLTGTTFTGESVAMNNGGSITACGTTAGDLACSGATTPARYTVVGAANQNVTVTSPAFTMTNGTDNLTFTPNVVGVANVVNTGANGNSTGVTFTIGGTLSGLANSTSDGTYTGTFAMTVAYQ